MLTIDDVMAEFEKYAGTKAADAARERLQNGYWFVSLDEEIDADGDVSYIVLELANNGSTVRFSAGHQPC